MWEDSDGASLGLALQGEAFQAYNEDAFRYFLALERHRVERSHRSSLLALVNLKKDTDPSRQIAAALAVKIFAGLSRCVREVDFIGWYREDRIAGAVLAQGTDMPGPEISRKIGQRITEVVGEGLAAHVARRLHVRLVHLRPAQKS